MNSDFPEKIASQYKAYRLTTDEMESGYTDEELWGQYLYKKYTDLGRNSLDYETAAMLSRHDLDSIIIFSQTADLNCEHDRIACETVMNCCKVLAELEEQL